MCLEERLLAPDFLTQSPTSDVLPPLAPRAVCFQNSTNAERPGYTLSERTVGDSLMQAFAESTGRIVVATFASNIHRIQQVDGVTLL